MFKRLKYLEVGCNYFRSEVSHFSNRECPKYLQTVETDLEYPFFAPATVKSPTAHTGYTSNPVTLIQPYHYLTLFEV